MNLTSLRSLVITALGLLAAHGVAHALDPINKSFFGGVALDGYDPVAYFTDGKPTPGSKEHTVEWNGATWRFATAANRDAFAAEPAKYAPQYGGYCAYAVANGYTADIDPQAWSVVEGKLYLNYDKKVQATWEADRDAMIRNADANWPKLVGAK